MINAETYGTLFVSGYIGDSDIAAPSINGSSLAGILSPFSGHTVYVRYSFSAEPISREAFLDLAVAAVEGEALANTIYSQGYSELTPASYSEWAMVGGHDLLKTFSTYRNQYGAIIVSTKPIADLAEALGLYD